MLFDDDDWDLDDDPAADFEADLSDEWLSHPSLTAAERNPSLVRCC